MKKKWLLMLNIVLLGAIAMLAFNSQESITGHVVKLNITDLDTGYTFEQDVAGKEVFFSKTGMPEKSNLEIINQATYTADADGGGSVCEITTYIVTKYREGNEIVYGTKIDENGCVAASIPEDYKLILG